MLEGDGYLGIKREQSKTKEIGTCGVVKMESTLQPQQGWSEKDLVAWFRQMSEGRVKRYTQKIYKTQNS